MKVLGFLCFVAVTQAGLITSNYSPAETVSTVYSSLNAPAYKTVTPLTYTKTFAEPAPVYESVLSTQESRTNNIDGTQQNTYAKSLITPYSSVNKFDSRTTNNGYLTHSVPVYSSGPVINHPQATYSVATPVVHSVSSPVTYTSHPSHVVTKTVSTPAYSTPVLTKTITPGVTSYTSHTPLVQAQPVKITYSEAPLVSHMSFTGLGTSYSW